MDIKNKTLFKDMCYINGEWINSNNKDRIKVNNPATLKNIGTVPKCGKEETSFAIMKANEAGKEWRTKSSKERSVILRNWYDLILENKDDLAHNIRCHPLNKHKNSS